MSIEVRIEPYGPGDLDLLVRANTPEMTEHLGGPEPAEKLADRHRRYLVHDRGDHMFRIEADGEPAGIVGYWERDWQDEAIYESGWHVLPEFQGRGVASAAVRLVQRTAAGRGRRWLHPYPSATGCDATTGGSTFRA